jgi:hypothetical protein
LTRRNKYRVDRRRRAQTGRTLRYDLSDGWGEPSARLICLLDKPGWVYDVQWSKP